jgi:hypothetical protein
VEQEDLALYALRMGNNGGQGEYDNFYLA